MTFVDFVEQPPHQVAWETLDEAVALTALVPDQEVGVLDQEDEVRMLVLLNQHGRAHYVLDLVDCVR